MIDLFQIIVKNFGFFYIKLSIRKINLVQTFIMTFYSIYEKVIIPAGSFKKTKQGYNVYYENDSFTYIKKIILFASVSIFVKDKNGNSVRRERICYFKGAMSETNLNESGNRKSVKEIEYDLIEMYKKISSEIKYELLKVDKNCYPLFKLL